MKFMEQKEYKSLKILYYYDNVAIEIFLLIIIITLIKNSIEGRKYEINRFLL